MTPRAVVFTLWFAAGVGQATDVAPSGLAHAAAYSASKGETGLLVWQGGRTIFERERNPAAPPPKVFSITKSLVSIGVIRDAKAGGLSLGQAATHRAARGAVLAELLNQTSGLPPAHREFYGQGLRDKEPVLDKLRRGGSGRFVYGPSHWEVLAEEIRPRRGSSLEGWIRKFVPGARAEAVARWTRDGKGRFFFSTGARMDAPGLLPAGREVLAGMRRAKWPRDVRALLVSGTEANRMYALGFWLNRGSREIDVESALGREQSVEFWREGCVSCSAPPDLLTMVGTRGQRVYAIPSRDLVVIRLGDGRGFSDAEFLRRLFGA